MFPFPHNYSPCGCGKARWTGNCWEFVFPLPLLGATSLVTFAITVRLLHLQTDPDTTNSELLSLRSLLCVWEQHQFRHQRSFWPNTWSKCDICTSGWISMYEDLSAFSLQKNKNIFYQKQVGRLILFIMVVTWFWVTNKRPALQSRIVSSFYKRPPEGIKSDMFKHEPEARHD